MEPTDFEEILEVFDRTGVVYREATPEEAADLANRFGVRDTVRRGESGAGSRAVLLARSEGRSPGPALLFDRDGNYVGLGDDRTKPALAVEFYGRS